MSGLWTLWTTRTQGAVIWSHKSANPRKLKDRSQYFKMPASYLTPHAFCSGLPCSFSHRSHQKLPCQGWKTWNPSRFRPNVLAMFFLVSSGEITRWRLAATAASVSISFVSVCILWILMNKAHFDAFWSFARTSRRKFSMSRNNEAPWRKRSVVANIHHAAERNILCS